MAKKNKRSRSGPPIKEAMPKGKSLMSDPGAAEPAEAPGKKPPTASPGGRVAGETKGAPDSLQSGGMSKSTQPDTVLAHLDVPKMFHQQFIAGCKSVMQFVTSPNTKQMLQNALKGPGPASQKLAEGVESMLLIILHQSKGGLPPQMYLPLGMWAISWVADFVHRAKLLTITDNDVGLAMQMFIHTTMMDLKKQQSGGGLLGNAQQGQGQQQGAPQPGGGQQQPGQPPQPPAGQQPPQPGPAMPKMKAAPAQAPGSNPNLGPGAAPGPQGVPQPAQG